MPLFFVFRLFVSWPLFDVWPLFTVEGTLPLTISGSLSKTMTATLIAVAGFVLLYQATIHDSRSARQASIHDPTLVPMAGSRLQFNATAYCKGTTTASGVGVQTGIAASDPNLLPVGSVVSIATQVAKYNGVYTIMDTGAQVQGRILDLYMWNCDEALAFGRREAQVTVLRLGWNPHASTPSLLGALFRRREKDRSTPPVVTPAPAVTPPPLQPGTADVTPAGAPAEDTTRSDNAAGRP